MIGFRIIAARAEGRRPRQVVEQFRPAARSPTSATAWTRMSAGGAGLRPHARGGTQGGPGADGQDAAGRQSHVHKALDLAEAGDVLVVDAGGDLTNALIGELMLPMPAQACRHRHQRRGARRRLDPRGLSGVRRRRHAPRPLQGRPGRDQRAGRDRRDGDRSPAISSSATTTAFCACLDATGAVHALASEKLKIEEREIPRSRERRAGTEPGSTSGSRAARMRGARMISADHQGGRTKEGRSMQRNGARARQLFVGRARLFGRAGLAQAQAYPNRPIRLIVPWPPGGGVDTAARIIAQPLAERLGQPIIARTSRVSRATWGRRSSSGKRWTATRS